MEDKTRNFLKTEILTQKRNEFFGVILITSIGYLLLTLWLNSIRASAPIFLVWVLIIIQFSLYFAIFVISYRRFKVTGLLKGFALPLFIILAVLGRVNDWEIIVIPILVLVMIILSAKTKNVPSNIKGVLSE